MSLFENPALSARVYEQGASITAAGAQLLEKLAPTIDDLDAQLALLANLSNQPTGTIRITAGDHAVGVVLMPRIGGFLKSWPEVTLEISIYAGLTDIVGRLVPADTGLSSVLPQPQAAIGGVCPPDRPFALAGTLTLYLQRSA